VGSGTATMYARASAVAVVAAFGLALTGCTNARSGSVATPSATSVTGSAGFATSVTGSAGFATSVPSGVASFDAAFGAATAEVDAAVAKLSPDQRHAIAIQWLAAGSAASNDPLTAARATWADVYLNLPISREMNATGQAQCVRLGEDVWPFADPNAYENNVARLKLDSDCTVGRLLTGSGGTSPSTCSQLADDVWPLADPNASQYNVARSNLDTDCIAERLPIGDVAHSPAACQRFSEDVFPPIDPSGADHTADRANLDKDCVAGRLPS
jgi:hypothetical protein